MTGDHRERILQSVRDALRPLREHGHPAPYPEYDVASTVASRRLTGGPSWESFRSNLESVHGVFLDSPAALVSYLHSRDAQRGYCDPALASSVRRLLGPDFTLDTVFDRDQIDLYAFGITKAAAAIAETGTVILHDTRTSSRLGALAPWIHVAWLTRDSLLTSLGQAVSSLGDDPNIVFVTGPSKTADVESVIVEGVHGPGEQVVYLSD